MIENVILAAGVSLKPSDTQLKEFGKRIKALNKQAVFNLIAERLALYEELSTPINTKILIVQLIF